MLDRARGGWETLNELPGAAMLGQLELIGGDITAIRLGRRFDLVILAFNSLLLLDGQRERAAAFATIRRHLTADGRAVLDIWQPSAQDLELYDGRTIEDWIKVDPETGDRVIKSTVATYDPVGHRASIRTLYDVEPATGPSHRLERKDDICFASPDELVTELEAAGLRVQSVMGDGTDMTLATALTTGRVTVVAALSVHPFHTSRTN